MHVKPNFLFILAIVAIAASVILLYVVGIFFAYSFGSNHRKGSDTGEIEIPTHASSETATAEAPTISESESLPEGSSTDSDTLDDETVPLETDENADTEIVTESETEPEEVASLEYKSLGNGTCAVVGIGSVTDYYLSIPIKSPSGEVVIEIAEKAFYDVDFIKAVEIPSTVWVIGEMAFSNCDSLIYISVNEHNKAFTDDGGVLYSKDMTLLLNYPSANGAPSITIPASVTEISPMAFNGCESLKTVYYEGSFEEWCEIKLGEMNYGLLAASILCGDTAK